MSFTNETRLSEYALRDGLRNVANKLETGNEVTVAFIGGSVTEGAGASDGEATSYRALTARYLKQRYPDVAFRFVNAAVGGTDSVYGAFRLKDHVLNEGPIDLLFAEFAVNDAGDRTASIRAMEGIVRHARRANPSMDIVFLYMANKKGLERYLQEDRAQNNIYHHDRRKGFAS